ncbi:MAG: hypothetical protein OEW00_09835 [candidate division Zixibacteria bacterium]|nr:hypothetical protein [candidate division Zixibacteria bacterium]
MMELKSTTALIKELRRLLLRQRLVLFLAGFVTTTAAVLAAWVVLSLLAGVMVLPVWLKITLLSAAGAAALYLFVRFALARLFYGSAEGVARSLEARHPELKGRLIAAIQFDRMKKTHGYSAELVAWTKTQALQQAALINFNDILSFHSLIRSGRSLLLAVGAALALLLVLPGIFSYSYEVYSHPGTEIAPPLGYKVIPVPASSEWVKYRDIDIGAAIVGDGFPEKAAIYHRLAGGSWQKSEIELRKMRRVALSAGDSLAVSVRLRQINKSFDFYVEAGRVKTEIQKIDVVDRPRVNAIKMSVFYPEYTGLEPTVINENNGSFSAVVGSRANLRIETNLPVRSAELVFDDSSRAPMKISDRFAETPFLVEQSRAYYIRLIDRLGEKNPDPIEYYITAVPDEYPSIDVLRPGYDVNLNDDMLLPLKVRIFDDYGFSSLVLKYTVVSHGRPSEEHVGILHFSERIKTEGEVEFNWDMELLNLFPGDYVVYYFEVADNDRVSGPKITKSRQFVARLPSLEEIIAETEAEGAQRIERTEDVLQRSKELMQRLKQAARKMTAREKSQEGADWQQQKELEAIADKNEQLLQDVSEMADKMNEAVNRMSENALLSREILEKLAEIQKLYQEVATPELREAQRRLMEALQKMDPEELMQAVKDMEMSQEELLERLERTLALLKRLQLQQKMEAMIRQVEQLAKRQEATNEETEAASDENLPSLTKDEQSTQSALQDLKAEAGDLREMLTQAQMQDSPDAREFVEQVQNTDADQDMSMMSQALQQGQKSQASQQGKKALSKLMDMLNAMQQAMQAMMGGEQDMLEKKMRMAIDDANYLSKDQEELLKRAAELAPNSLMLQEMAASQQDLAGACNGLKRRIAELGKVSPFIAAELGALVNQAALDMETAMQQFDSRSGRQAQTSQREAMTGLNRVSLRLMESLEQQKQCDKGSNCSKGMQQLQSLCNKQNSLNRQTQTERQGFERLAREQAAIRKSVEDLAREMGNSRQVLGRLDDIAREMKKVEEALEDGPAGPETTERQLKIYSRMLEATRSLQRKDFSEQRQAETATSQVFLVPPELSNGILNDKVRLEDRLRRYLGEGYPRQYEEQIKAYFKALLQAASRRDLNDGAPVIEP